MSYKYCSSKHVYDESLSECPYCQDITDYKNKTSSAILSKKTERINYYEEAPLKTKDTDYSSLVTGWLVVVDGLGFGSDLPIRHGLNKIGRVAGDIVINFGDESISREKHAFLAYDQEEKIFVIFSGEGRNLLKVNNNLVLDSKVLVAYDEIKIGSTTLLFKPFCNEVFNWSFLE